jgi:hypothetical protein
VGIKESHPLFSQPLESGGLDPAVRIGRRNISNSQIIGHDQDNVGGRCSLSMSRL